MLEHIRQHKLNAQKAFDKYSMAQKQCPGYENLDVVRATH